MYGQHRMQLASVHIIHQGSTLCPPPPTANLNFLPVYDCSPEALQRSSATTHTRTRVSSLAVIRRPLGVSTRQVMACHTDNPCHLTHARPCGVHEHCTQLLPHPLLPCSGRASWRGGRRRARPTSMQYQMLTLQPTTDHHHCWPSRPSALLPSWGCSGLAAGKQGSRARGFHASEHALGEYTPRTSESRENPAVCKPLRTWLRARLTVSIASLPTSAIT
jgi:hypothetical protein